MDSDLGRKYYGGSPACTEENLDFFIEKLKEYNTDGRKLTFCQWILKMMILLDLID